MITLPYGIGRVIRDAITLERNKNNIPEPIEVSKLSVHRKADTFLESEFELIKELNINSDVMEYIEYFPNVTSITIDSTKEIELIDYKYICDHYPNLEKLVIKGQSNFTYLDVTKLPKLRHLELISNPHLRRIYGFEHLNHLEQFTFYDNITFTQEEELCESVTKKTENGTHVNLDVLYIPTIKEIGLTNPDSFNWCESVGIGEHGDELKYDTKELEEALVIAQEIVSTHIKPTDTTIQKYAILYEWMCNNIMYDRDALDGELIYKEKGKSFGKIGGTNGTVNGLVYGSCICEGYSKSMQLLLKLCKIPSFDVSCFAEERNGGPTLDLDNKKKIHRGDHSILKVNIDGDCYYSDITWDANLYQLNEERKYFLLSKKDISVDHKLTGEEGVVTYGSINDEEFKSLTKFAHNRIEEAKKEIELKKQKRLIAEIQKLFRIRITPYRAYYDEESSELKTTLKDKDALIKEMTKIYQELDNLYNQNQLTQQAMYSYKKAVLEEYQKIVVSHKDFYIQYFQNKKGTMNGATQINQNQINNQSERKL